MRPHAVGRVRQWWVPCPLQVPVGRGHHPQETHWVLETKTTHLLTCQVHQNPFHRMFWMDLESGWGTMPSSPLPDSKTSGEPLSHRCGEVTLGPGSSRGGCSAPSWHCPAEVRVPRLLEALPYMAKPCGQGPCLGSPGCAQVGTRRASWACGAVPPCWHGALLPA